MMDCVLLFLTGPQTAFANRYGMVNKYLGDFEWKNIVKLAKAIVTRDQKIRIGSYTYFVCSSHRNNAPQFSIRGNFNCCQDFVTHIWKII